MVAVAQGAVLGASNPVLACWIADTFGFLAAPDSLSFTVFDVTTDTNALAPVTVYGPHAVDLVNDQVASASGAPQVGRYAAAWTVSGTEPVGRHRITWTASITSTDQDGTASTETSIWSRDFDVLAIVVSTAETGYALVADLRDEGYTSDRVSDARLLKLIKEASLEFERMCGSRWFEPRYRTWQIDGNWRSVLMLDEPIVAVDYAAVYGEGVQSATDYKVYNRHVQGLVQPDDRQDPKLEFFITQPGLQGPVQPLAYPYPISESWLTPKVWARGTKNISVAGVFGYTDHDGSPEGRTPADVTYAVKLLVLRRLPLMSRHYERFDALNRHRIKTEKTREQSYELVPGRAGTGAYTSDVTIDDIVERYSRPPLMGAV